jgi:ABC-type transport system substrate-binding protein
MNKKHFKILSLLLIVVFLVSASTPAATPPAVAPEDNEEAAHVENEEAAPAEPEAPAAADPMTYLDAPREDTVIFDQPYKLENFDNWNPFVPGNSYGWGMSEIGSDGLMYLNYGDGEYIMWMAEEVTSNDDATEWVLKLRKQITWNDGKPFTADDIVFTTEMQIANDKLSNHFYWDE